MTVEDLKSRIDPKTLTRFDIWYGGEAFNAKSIGDVMNLRFFDGKSLSEIIDKVTFIEE